MAQLFLEKIATLALGEWLSALKLGRMSESVLAQLDSWGVAEPTDLSYLTEKEVGALTADMKLVQRRKLEKAIGFFVNTIHGSVGDTVTQPADSQPADSQRGGYNEQSRSSKPPTAKDCEAQGMVLRDFIGNGCRTSDTQQILYGIHTCWSGCVADPSWRAALVPILFRVVTDCTCQAVRRDATIAVVFLSFSLSGTTLAVSMPIERPLRTHASPSTVLVFGWAGSGNDDFTDLTQFYRESYPSCKVVVTVGGSDLWRNQEFERRTNTTVKTAIDGGVRWPTSQLATSQLSQLVDEVAGPRVLVHSFSNNGMMLHTRLLKHLMTKRDEYLLAPNIACRATRVLASICAVVVDSAPDPSYNRSLLKGLQSLQSHRLQRGKP